MPCRPEIASRYGASARSRCTSVRPGRAAIPRPARPWRFPASTFRTSSRARTCASASTMERIVPSGTNHPDLMSAAPAFPAFLDLEPWQQGSFHFDTALPGSKSLTLRDCALAALAQGESLVRSPGKGDDYWRMKDCLRRLGVAVDDSREGEVRIAGRGGQFAPGR